MLATSLVVTNPSTRVDNLELIRDCTQERSHSVALWKVVVYDTPTLIAFVMYILMLPSRGSRLPI